MNTHIHHLNNPKDKRVAVVTFEYTVDSTYGLREVNL
jgi:hypothetical protein